MLKTGRTELYELTDELRTALEALFAAGPEGIAKAQAVYQEMLQRQESDRIAAAG